MSAAEELRRLIVGQQVSQAVCVAAELGVADLLVSGPRTSEELARATRTDVDALYRLLRALASIGILYEEEGCRFGLAELGEPLRSDAPDSVAAVAVHVGRPYVRAAWSALIESVRTGENAFRHVHGTSIWEYRASRPEDNAIFDQYIAANTRLGTHALLEVYDFGRFRSIVDVGGGSVLVIERLFGPPNEGPEAKFADQNMLVGPGGRERTLDEYEALLAAAAYRLVGATPSNTGLFILEGEPSSH